MKFDEVLREIGELGPFQRRVYFLATFPTILAAAETMSMLFIFNIPPHRCAIPNFPDDQFHVTNDIHLQSLNSTVPKEDDGTWSKCHVYSDVNSDVITTNHSDVIAGKRRIPDSPDLAECDRWVYDQSVFTSTVPTEFNTVCGRLMYRASSHMVVEIGCLLGTLICGVLADRFGRKIPFYVGGLALVGGGFGIAFSTSFITLNICRFILGIARMTLFINGLVLGMEMVGPSKRVLVGIAIEVMWCVGMVLLLVMGYFIRNWRYLEIALSVPSIVLLAYWWLIPESPRWLATKGRKEEALKVLEKIAASNGTTLPKVDDVTHLLEAEHSLSFLHVFKSRELVLRMLILFFNMFTILVNYYVLSYNISNLSGDIFVNFFLNIILELLGLTFPYLLLDRLGRKKVCCSSTFLGGAACMACVLPGLLGGPDWIITVLASIGRFFVCIAFSSLYIYGAEIFPTVIRASTMGLGVTFARFGGLVAPYLADAGILVGGKLEKALPLIIMGPPAMLAALMSLWLPETKGTRMLETLHDVKPRQRRNCLCGVSDSGTDSEEYAAVETIQAAEDTIQTAEETIKTADVTIPTADATIQTADATIQTSDETIQSATTAC